MLFFPHKKDDVNNRNVGSKNLHPSNYQVLYNYKQLIVGWSGVTRSYSAVQIQTKLGTFWESPWESIPGSFHVSQAPAGNMHLCYQEAY